MLSKIIIVFYVTLIVFSLHLPGFSQTASDRACEEFIPLPGDSPNTKGTKRIQCLECLKEQGVDTGNDVFTQDLLSPAEEDSCGFWTVDADTFIINYRRCVDLRCRYDNGLVLRIDTLATVKGQSVRQGYRSMIAAKLTPEFLPENFTAGFYQISAVVDYNAAQQNETFYFEAKTGPCDSVNFSDRLIVIPDTDQSGEVETIFSGEFFLSFGDTIFFRHFQLLIGDDEALKDEARAKGLLNGDFNAPESIKLKEIRLIKVPRQPALRLTKSADKLMLAAGDSLLSYTFVLSNASSVDTARSVVLTDILPEDVMLQTGTIRVTPQNREIPPVVAGNLIRWNFGKLSPNDSLVITFQVRVDRPTTDSLLTNVATVRSSCGADTAQVSVVVAPDFPNLTVTKTSDRLVVTSGDALNYTIRVTNTHPFEIARNVVVKDSLPPFVRSGSTDFDPVVDFIIGDLAPGDTTFVFRAFVAIDAPKGLLINRVEVSADNEDPEQLGDNVAFDTVSVILPDLSITKSSVQEVVSRGDTIDYTITVTNHDTDVIAKNVAVTDSLPDFVRVDSTDFAGIVRFAGSSKLDLNPSSSMSWTFQALVSDEVPGSTLLVNRVNVTAGNEDPDNLSNNVAFDTVLVVVPPPPDSSDITVTKQSIPPDTVIAGGRLEYEIAVTNIDTTAAALNVTVVDTLPPFIGTDEAGPGGILTWNFAFLAPGADTIVTVDAFVTPDADSGRQINRVFVSAENECSDCRGDNAAFDTVYIVLPDSADLTITKIADPDEVAPGGIIDYTITVTNNSNVLAENVIIEDILPSLVRVDTSSFGATLNWSLGDLGAGASTTLVFGALVSNTAVGGEVLVNCATVQGDNEASDRLSDNTACDTVTVRPVTCDLALSKSANVDSVAANDVFEYTFLIENFAAEGVRDIVVTDTLPSFVTPIDWPGTEQAGILFLSIPALLQDTTITFSVRVAGTLPENMTKLVNRAGLAADCDTDEANNFASNTVFIDRPDFDCIVLDRNVFEPEVFDARFEQELQILFELEGSGHVEMKLYDTAADFITTLTNQSYGPGKHAIAWDGRTEMGDKVGSGVYIIIFRLDDIIECIQKVIVAR